MNSKTSIPVCITCLPHIKSGQINQLSEGQLTECPECGLDIPSRQYFYILEHNRKGQKPIEHTVISSWEEKQSLNLLTVCKRCQSDLTPSLITGELVCTHCPGGTPRHNKMGRGAK